MVVLSDRTRLARFKLDVFDFYSVTLLSIILEEKNHYKLFLMGFFFF